MGYRVSGDERRDRIVPPMLRGDEASAADALSADGEAASLEQTCRVAPLFVVRVLAGRMEAVGESVSVSAGAGECLVHAGGASLTLRADGAPARWQTVAVDLRARDRVLALEVLKPASSDPILCASDSLVAAEAEHFVELSRSRADAATTAKALHRFVVGVVFALVPAEPEIARAPGRSLDGRRTLHARLLAVKRLVHETHGNVGVAEMSAAAGLSSWYFVRTFHAVFGETPYQYALDRRMAYARHLLLETDASVREIALAVGFGNSSAFVRAFGQRFGHAPTALRRHEEHRNSVKTSPHRGLREGAEAEARALVRGMDGLTTRKFV